MNLINYPYLARLVSVSATQSSTVPSSDGGTKSKKHRSYPVRLLDWARTFRWMLDADKISELDEDTKLKIKTLLEETVLPYMKKLEE
jgi:hypothetical protein